MTRVKLATASMRGESCVIEDDPSCPTVECAECLTEIREERAVKWQARQRVRHFCDLDFLR